jgi:tetratricopeptide (TPR) repeat protein
MKSLRNYHASTSTSLKVKDILTNVEILFNKELFNHCMIEIGKAEKLAQKTEDDLVLLEILNWKRKLSQSQSPGASTLITIVEDQASALKRLNYHNELWKELVRPTKSASELIEDSAKSTTLSAKVLSYHIRYREAIRLGKSVEAKTSLTELVSKLEKHPDRINEEPSIYFSTLNNLISYLVFTGEIDQAIESVDKAKSFYHNIERLRKDKGNFRLILRTYNIELEIYRDTESLSNAAKLIQEIQLMLSDHKGKVPESYLVSLWFQFAYIYFLRKEFRQALHWINQILNSEFAHERMDLHLQTNLLNLMVHLELRNFFVMRYFVASAKRFFSRNKALLPYHKIVLAFFTKISGMPEGEHRQMFQQLNAQLFSNPDTIPKKELDYINWRKWILNKSERNEHK